MTSGTERLSGGLRARLRSARTGSPRTGSPRTGSQGRRELIVAMLLGAAGAGIVFLASRQGWAQVRTTPPKPLPASSVTVTGAALVPYADALVLAGLATLAAVLASRGLARRLTGVLLALLGASLVASAFTVSTAAAITAANANVGPATASAGSVTDGSGSAASAVPNVAGAVPHVTFSAAGWQVLVVLGAIVMIAAGALVAWRADRMAVMSSRYDSPAGDARRAGADRGRSSGRTPRRDQQAAASAETSASATATAAAADSASMWEALSRGDDPTAGHSEITRAGSADSGSRAT
jgi:uncharacterized membrane protein (TIGR02234 family)